MSFAFSLCSIQKEIGMLLAMKIVAVLVLTVALSAVLMLFVVLL